MSIICKSCQSMIEAGIVKNIVCTDQPLNEKSFTKGMNLLGFSAPCPKCGQETIKGKNNPPIICFDCQEKEEN